MDQNRQIDKILHFISLVPTETHVVYGDTNDLNIGIKPFAIDNRTFFQRKNSER